MPIHEVVRELSTALGPTLVAALAGTTNTKAPIRWAKSDGPEPGADFTYRLQVGHRVWTQLVDAEGPSIARNWFLAANPLLDEDTPITAIRENRARQVVAAATAFATDQPAT
jgi:hypothetical protein